MVIKSDVKTRCTSGRDHTTAHISHHPRRYGRLAACVAAVTLGFSAFASSANAGVLIGVVFPTQNQMRWAWEQKIFAAQAKANGDDVVFQFSNESASMQKDQVESMIQRQVKVLVMTAIDAQAGASLVKEAQSHGIKVITYDRGVVGANPDYAVERNNYEAGKLQAEAALAAVPSGDYAVIRGDQSTVAQVITSRAYDQLLKHKPGVNIVYDQLTPGWDTATAQREAEAAIQKTPGIKSFVVMWDNAAQAVVQALKSAGKKPGEVFVSGMDAAPASLAYIAQGWQTQTIWTPIDEMAKDAADIAHALGTGKGAPPASATVNGVPVRYVKLVSINKGNLCDFITKIAPQGWISPAQVFGAQANTCK